MTTYLALAELFSPSLILHNTLETNCNIDSDEGSIPTTNAVQELRQSELLLDAGISENTFEDQTMAMTINEPMHDPNIFGHTSEIELLQLLFPVPGEQVC